MRPIAAAALVIATLPASAMAQQPVRIAPAPAISESERANLSRREREREAVRSRLGDLGVEAMALDTNARLMLCLNIGLVLGDSSLRRTEDVERGKRLELAERLKDRARAGLAAEDYDGSTLRGQRAVQEATTATQVMRNRNAVRLERGEAGALSDEQYLEQQAGYCHLLLDDMGVAAAS